ncbi:hypothetical protein ACLKA6_001757 [Drosophila palustris]
MVPQGTGVSQDFSHRHTVQLLNTVCLTALVMVRAAASTSKSCQSANVVSEMVTMPADPTKTVTPEMVTMPAGQANCWFKAAKSAAVPPAGARTVGVAPTAGAKEILLHGEKKRGDILQRNHNCAVPNLSAEWLRKSGLGQERHPGLENRPPKRRLQPRGSFKRHPHLMPRSRGFNRADPSPRLPRRGSSSVSWIEVIWKEASPEANGVYKAAVVSVGEVYPGAKLEAVNWEDVPARPRARMWFPSTIKEPEQLLKILQRCGDNPQQGIVGAIDVVEGELNFGFSSVFIRVYKSDAAIGGAPSDKPVEEDITAELEAPERPEPEATTRTSSLTRDLSKLWQEGDLEVTSDLASDDDDVNATVVEGKSTDVLEGSADKPPPLIEDNTAVSLESQPAHNQATVRLYAIRPGCDANAHHTQWGAPTQMQGGAFNNVFPEAITEALTGLGVEGRLVRLISQLLTSRAVTSTLGSSTLTREEWAVKPPGKPGSLTFYTDGSKLENQSRNAANLHEMAGHFDICLIWVPGHQDIPGNCIVDELARIGTTNVLLLTKRTPVFPWRPANSCSTTNPTTKAPFAGKSGLELQGYKKKSLRNTSSVPVRLCRRLRTLGKPFLDDLGGLSAISPRKIALFIQFIKLDPFNTQVSNVG